MVVWSKDKIIYIREDSNWTCRQTHKDGDFEVIIKLDDGLTIILTDEFISKIKAIPDVL